VPNSPDDFSTRSRIAVAIPCYNEAAAIATVIEQFREAIPGASIVVFDNNSNDGTGAIARSSGAEVVDVPAQGKGNVVRAAFTRLADCDVVLLVDGDGTYPAESAPSLVAPVLDGSADMVVGARQPVPGMAAMSPVRGLGNRLIRATFGILIGPGAGDLLSGYRAFSKRFRQQVELRATGFEIETELNSEAVGRRLKTIEVSVPYRPRIAGTVSKLRAGRDGLRIVTMILLKGIRLRPQRLFLAWFVVCLPLAPLLGPFLAVPLGLGCLMILSANLIISRRGTN
jgi:glycosyltransferase involved in cell wall biosynthesis